jgi:ABC-2 type transport system ATP-binding protein
MLNSPTASQAVRVRELQVVRGARTVLQDVSLDLATGMVTGLLGPSGSGKTTLMRSIVGVQKIAGGTIQVLGQPAGHPNLRHRIGYRTQAPSVYFDLTVSENLRYFAAVLGVENESVERVIGEVDLTTNANHLVARLSAGEQARVSVAVALLGRPDVLVLDEPTVGLDPVLRRDLWQLFHTLASNGAVLLVSSHVMDEAERCDRLLLLTEGRLLADSLPKALLERTGAPNMDAAFLALVEGRRIEGNQ